MRLRFSIFYAIIIINLIFVNCGKTSSPPPPVSLVSIALVPTSPSITKGATQQFSATGTYSDNTTKDLTSSVTWNSATTSVATISSGGLVTGVGVGESVISATSESVNAKTTITITAANLVSIAVTPMNPSIAKGLTQQFTATATYSDNTTKDITSSATWSSGNTAAATITTNGLASAVGIGTSAITATSGTISGNTSLTVTVAKLVSIVIKPADTTISQGVSQQFRAIGTYTDNTTNDITSSVTWNSTTTATATISTIGLAYAAGIGTSKISATSESISANTTLTVIGSSHWKKVAAGRGHTLGISDDGTLWAWGFNGSNQLGDGTNIKRLFPTQISTQTDWASISAGDELSAAIKSNGTLWLWGRVTMNGVVEFRNTPTQVSGSADWASVSAGGLLNVAAIKTDGTLWLWTGDINDPAQVGTSNDWASVSLGAGFILAIKTDGTLWAWGSNSHGQLGDGSTANSTIPIQIGTSNNWASVSAGQFHSAALQKDGSYWVWGSNSFGQHGDGSSVNSDKTVPSQVGTETNWTSVSASEYNTVLRKSNGTLWGAGAGGNGQLGTLQFGLPLSSNVLIQMGTDNDWSMVSEGNGHTMAIKIAGTLWGCGANGLGQLGDGTTTDRLLFVNIK